MGESGGLSAALLTAASWSCDQGAVNPSNCPISAHCSSRQAGPGRCERIGPSRKRGTRLSPQAQGPHRECTTRKPFGVWHTKLRVHSYTTVRYQFGSCAFACFAGFPRSLQHQGPRPSRSALRFFSLFMFYNNKKARGGGVGWPLSRSAHGCLLVLRSGGGQPFKLSHISTLLLTPGGARPV